MENLENKNREELIEIAESLGINVTWNTKRETLIQKITKAEPQKEPVIDDLSELKQKIESLEKKVEEQAKKPQYTMPSFHRVNKRRTQESMAIIRKGLEAEPKDDVFLELKGVEKRQKVVYTEVGLNGVMFRVRKGVSLKLPRTLAKLIRANIKARSKIGMAYRLDRDFEVDKDHPIPLVEALS